MRQKMEQKIITATFLKDPKKTSKAVNEHKICVTKGWYFCYRGRKYPRNLEYFPSVPATLKSSNVLTVASMDKYGGLSFLQMVFAHPL